MRGLDTDEFVVTFVPGNIQPSPLLQPDASAKMGRAGAAYERQHYGRFRSVAELDQSDQVESDQGLDITSEHDLFSETRLPLFGIIL
jgi:hypothetical protein